jgi:hypothetical protein
VPFELGRPLGVPCDPAWQTRVLLSTLELFEASSGPVLVDFPDDAPQSDEPAVLACPVNFPALIRDLSDAEQLCETLQLEIAELGSWYDLAASNSGRTTFGVTGLDPEAVGSFIGSFLGGKIPLSPRDDLQVFEVLKLALEDLKAYYFEAMAAQPGHIATGPALDKWLWQETAAGKVMFALQDLWKDSDDPGIRLFSTILNGSQIPRS